MKYLNENPIPREELYCARDYCDDVHFNASELLNRFCVQPPAQVEDDSITPSLLPIAQTSIYDVCKCYQWG